MRKKIIEDVTKDIVTDSIDITDEEIDDVTKDIAEDSIDITDEETKEEQNKLEGYKIILCKWEEEEFVFTVKEYYYIPRLLRLEISQPVEEEKLVNATRIENGKKYNYVLNNISEFADISNL